MPVGSRGLTEVLKGFGWAYKSGERASNGDGGWGGGYKEYIKNFRISW